MSSLTKDILEFNVLWYDINDNKLKYYDIVPYFVESYKTLKTKKPKTIEEFREFIISKSRYMFKSRCEYEIIVSGHFDTPKEKWDIHDQIIMNIDVIVKLLMKELKSHGNSKKKISK